MSSYQSIFKEDMGNFIQFRRTCGLDCRELITVLNSLDTILCENNVSDKNLTEEIVRK
jgi:hypothetical protein